jgi:hypothetical protein
MRSTSADDEADNARDCGRRRRARGRIRPIISLPA